MHKNATKCNETLSKWCKNKHGASKIMDTLETYHPSPSIVYIIFVERTKWSNIIMMMYKSVNPWIFMDIRISGGFGFGATSMPMDTFMGGAR
jgi:hypothetical protein